jgi:hypothetical protein
MQILPKTTDMKTFNIVLPVITVSTLLAVFVLTGAVQEVRKAISRNIPSPEQKLRELMLEHPRERWRKEQLGRWTYLAFLAELCFVSIPIHEVKEAADLYGLRNRRPARANSLNGSISLQHLRSNTTLTSTLTSDNTTNNGEANAKSLARQVLEVQLAEKESSRKGSILIIFRQAGTGIFIAVRILLLCLWIPLLLLEYVVLLFCCPFTGVFRATMQPDSQLRISKSEQLKRFFVAPFLLLDFDLSQFRTWRRRPEHEHRSPAPPSGPIDDLLETFPRSYFYRDPVAGNRRPGPGRESHLRGAVRHIIARPTFQAALPSGSSLAAIPAQPSMHLRPRGYSDVEGGIPRRAGGV